jgi:hypothetical protein
VAEYDAPAPVRPGVLVRLPLGNADVEWDSFDSHDYFQRNYGELRTDDARIIEIVADFFHSVAPPKWRTHALDVGSGANIYPALTMLPFASTIALRERAYSNRDWLTNELRHPHDSWKQFWAAISAGRPEYERITAPIDLLLRNATVQKESIFALEPDQFDLGTMFFVAESITTRHSEFVRASRTFVESLVPRAPFAAAFMRDSMGYVVGGNEFPACAVSKDDVAACLASVAAIEDIQIVESHDLREGYSGMIVATGWKR